MITPRFNLDQNDNQLHIQIFAPFTNIKSTEISVDENDFRFFSAPYYLRLNLPGKVEETDSSSARFNSDGGYYDIYLDKMNPGETFPRLDMIASFLLPKANGTDAIKTKIEVLSSSTTCDESESEMREEIEGDEWFTSQEVEEEMPTTSLLNQHKYGFAHSYSGLGGKYQVELGEVSEIQNPDCISPSDRRKLREERELQKFSDDHYLADFMTLDENYLKKMLKVDFRSLDKLNSGDKEKLKNIANKEFLLDKMWLKRVSLGLIDILYAFALDLRQRKGESCIESCWNISHVSATLSWFETFDSVQDVLKSCLRRSLCYPLCRHWKLSTAAFQDIINILKLGDVSILKCLLYIHKEFNSREPFYLLNQLYIQDYIIWIQSKDSACLATLIPALEKCLAEVTKAHLGLDLEELELAAKLVQEEEMEEEISYSIQQVQI